MLQIWTWCVIQKPVALENSLRSISSQPYLHFSVSEDSSPLYFKLCLATPLSWDTRISQIKNTRYLASFSFSILGSEGYDANINMNIKKDACKCWLCARTAALPWVTSHEPLHLRAHTLGSILMDAVAGSGCWCWIWPWQGFAVLGAPSSSFSLIKCLCF